MNERFEKYAREDWPLLVAFAGVVALTVFAYPSLPAEVPTHWDWRGVPDDFSPKTIACALMPIGAWLSYALVALLLAVDPKRGDESPRTMAIFRMLTPAFLLALHVVMLATWLTGGSFDILGMLYAGTGVMFAVMGNFLTKVRPNYVVGIRVPWTLEDDVVWRKTHRFAGPIFFVGGLSMIFTLLFGPVLQFIYFVAVSMVMCIAPTVYAYRLYHQRHPQGR